MMTMAILDAGPFQDWIRAFDGYERAQRRYDAAGRTGNQALVDYLRPELEAASRDLNTAIKILNSQAR
jgi:hypothetical protein